MVRLVQTQMSERAPGAAPALGSRSSESSSRSWTGRPLSCRAVARVGHRHTALILTVLGTIWRVLNVASLSVDGVDFRTGA